MLKNDLVVKYRTKQEEIYLEEILKESEYLVLHLINKYSPLIQTLESTDLKSEARMIIMYAIKNFDENRNAKFTTYLYRILEYHFIKIVRNQRTQKRNMKSFSFFEDQINDKGFTFHDVISEGDTEDEMYDNYRVDTMLDYVERILSKEEFNLYKRYIYGESVQELARTEDTKYETMRNKMSYIRRKIKEGKKNTNRPDFNVK